MNALIDMPRAKRNSKDSHSNGIGSHPYTAQHPARMGAINDESEASEPPIRARPVNSSRAILALN